VRIRYIKPEFFVDEDVTACSPLARLAFAGLWCAADRDGRVEYRPTRLRLLLLPADDCDFSALVDELVAHNLITRYSNDGKQVIAIPGFKKHQRPHPREAESTLPAAKSNGKNRASRVITRPAVKSNGQQAGNGDGDGDGRRNMSGGAPDPVPFREIVDRLNAKTGSQYRHTSKATQSHIRARWADGFRLDDFQAVIDAKAAEWGRDQKWAKFLRPETLFGAKFEGYRENARKNGKRARDADDDMPDLDALAAAARGAS
jgi:uncharacterized phage protein (TIGR02220 family)